MATKPKPKPKPEAIEPQPQGDEIIDTPPEKIEPQAPVAKLGPEAVDDKFTRCWRVGHPHYGTIEVLTDTKEQAIEIYLQKRAPAVDVSEIAKELLVAELPFVPAATEQSKPHGWPREKIGRIRDGR